MRRSFSLLLLLLPLLLFGCKTAEAPVLPQEPPAEATTDYSAALARFGRLAEAFGSGEVRIQATDIRDATGVGLASGGELPFDVTQMLVSALNRMGGGIVVAPYEPSYAVSMRATGYTDLAGMARPHARIEGGITEYDRDLDMSFERGSIEDESGTVLELLSQAEAWSDVDRIALDLNLADSASGEMLPRVQAVSAMLMHDSDDGSNLEFTLFGASLSLSDRVSLRAGRHAAVRVLVEMGALQVMGRYLNLPWWKCLDEGADPDPVVVENLRDAYVFADRESKTAMLQRLLMVHGYGVRPDGIMDRATVDALKAWAEGREISLEAIDENVFIELFLSAPAPWEQGAPAPVRAGGSELPSLMPALADPPLMMPEDTPLSVDMWTDRGEYRAGQAMRITFMGNHDFYGQLFYVSADGRVIQLLPNARRDISFFRGGRAYSVPDLGDGYALEVDAPFGAEELVLYAAPRPLAPRALRPVGAGLGQTGVLPVVEEDVVVVRRRVVTGP